VTALNHVTDTMATVLRTRLSTAAVDVRSFDGRFGADGKDFVTVKAPGVLVACLGFAEQDDQIPVEVDAQFFAVCITRTPDNAGASGAHRTPADIAAVLATLVTRIVKTERWEDSDDIATTSGPATRVRASNDYTNALSMKGMSAWAVTWNQRVELDPEITEAELTNLTTLFFTLAMGPDGTAEEQEADDTPDIEIQVDLPEDVV
jgi:hypothetical protein